MTPIIFIPGLLCSAEVFSPQIAALWPFGPTTVASTLEGISIEQIATAILRNAPPSFALAGISMGGYIAFEIMRQAPDRVMKLALLNTSARADTPEQSEQRRALARQARQHDFARWTEEALTSLSHPSRHADALLRAVNRRMGVAIGVDGFARQVEAACTRPDSRPSLGDIRVPTLVLAGKEDAVLPVALSQEIASLIGGSELVVISECGHASPLERPELVSSALIAWLRR